jgi:hypothetical protein
VPARVDYGVVSPMRAESCPLSQRAVPKGTANARDTMFPSHVTIECFRRRYGRHVSIPTSSTGR